MMKNKYLEISPSRADIVTQNLGFCLNGLSVIEFGASSGETLRDLKNNNNCKVKAYDLFPVSLDFCESLYFDIDLMNFTDIKENLLNCDLVLFLDVLEHVRQPKQVILEIFKINPNLKIFVVSPNFASVRLLWAWCRGFVCEYNSGYFDRTHIK